MAVEQVTLRELVRDPIYRKWIKTPPLGGFSEYARFRVYAQRAEGGSWAKRDFTTFAPAYNFLVKHYKSWHDAALTCTNQESRPPVVRYKGKRQYYAPLLLMPGHLWCGFCRRPTVFGYYTTHHTFSAKGIKPLSYKLRCGICGNTEDSIRRFKGVTV